MTNDNRTDYWFPRWLEIRPDFQIECEIDVRRFVLEIFSCDYPSHLIISVLKSNLRDTHLLGRSNTYCILKQTFPSIMLRAFWIIWYSLRGSIPLHVYYFIKRTAEWRWLLFRLKSWHLDSKQRLFMYKVGSAVVDVQELVIKAAVGIDSSAL